MRAMLQQLITTVTARPATKNATCLQPVELKQLLESMPEVAQKLRVRQAKREAQPRSVCTSLKDLCEF